MQPPSNDKSSSSVLLSIDNLGSEHARKVFESLRQIDRNAIFVEVEADPASSDGRDLLADLLWNVGLNTVGGLLVVVLPPDIPAAEVHSRLTSPADRGLITLSPVQQSAESFRALPWHSALGLAERYGRQGLFALIVCNPPVAKISPFQFQIVDYSLANEDLFHTLVATRKYSFASSQEYAITNSVGPLPPRLAAWDSPLKPADIYSEWLHQEFQTRDAAAGVLKIISEAFPVQQEGKPILFPRRWQTTLGALRLARRMANWCLEGEPFECSVLWTTTDQVSQIYANTHKQLRRLFLLSDEKRGSSDPSKTVPFDFLHESEVRSIAESAQSQELFLVGNADTGDLELVAVSIQEKASRYDRFVGLAKPKNVVMHVRTGYVEVYSDAQLQLWHDGFRYVVKPFSLLKQTLDEHFDERELGDDKTKVVSNVLGAIANLMDRQQGSTIILLHPQEDGTATPNFNEYAKDSLRPPLRDGENTQHHFQLSSLLPATTASILHLDGAHAITNDGLIKYVARQIRVSDDQSEKNISSFGTGTRAALDLSRVLPRSIAIRVSASGGLHIFSGGKERRNALSGK